ncbi:MAG TPA: ATP-binding cassette domain-containing protein [Thermomicrobiales bacterium]|nr:ATP-binding cassette domain-containing protein [Thermomicrobiales bacterium]
MSLDILHITKRYGEFTAVDDVSFTVAPGRIFGFLGTNGAGKTTTMRMILDIIRPDSGQITWEGVPISDIPRKEFGYLPEERGLYPKMIVEDQLLFLAQLYGAPKAKAKQELDAWLEFLQITENRRKTVEQLSKGNQQKIQFLAAVLHDPDILILDEPFSGLDPVNAEQMKQAFRTMRDRGKTIIFSTHQLDDAQELCHDVSIIHRGRLMIAGTVPEVRQSTGEQYVRLAIAGDPRIAWLDDLPGVTIVRRREDYVEMAVPEQDDARVVLQEAMRRNAPVTRFEIDYPSLNDVFLTLVRQLPADARPGAPVVEEEYIVTV